MKNSFENKNQSSYLQQSLKKLNNIAIMWLSKMLTLNNFENPFSSFYNLGLIIRLNLKILTNLIVVWI